MHAFRLVTLAGVACALSSCTTSPYVRLDERSEACHIAVVENFGHPRLQPNEMSGSAGTFAGAGKGMAEGLAMGRDAIILAPLGAIIGAGYGTACAAAASHHPTANADFEQLLRDADSTSLRHAIEARLASPRPECDAHASGPEPDARLEIEKVEFGMACLMGKQEFQVTSEWRTVTARTGHVLNESRTMIVHQSARSVDDWFAHPAQARAEIEQSLARLGEAMAAQFVSSTPPTPPAPVQ